MGNRLVFVCAFFIDCNIKGCLCVLLVCERQSRSRSVFFFNGLLVGSHQVLLQLIYDCNIKTFLMGEIILFY